VFRILGKTAGILVLLVDALKGFIACRYVAVGPNAPSEAHEMVAGLFAILGHNYTCWLRFKGGKGVATTAGVLLALAPIGFAVAIVTFLIALGLSRYVSLSSIIAAIVLPFGVWLGGGTIRVISLMTFFSAMAIYKHRS